MYRYETHLHTRPASACARCGVRESLEFYREQGYDGVFITNHFLDGNFKERNNDTLSYREKVKIYNNDYYEGVEIGKDIGLKVFFGLEISYGGTDFLVYGLPPEWWLDHPEIMDMKKSQELPFLMSQGALVIQAHPFREEGYIDHIRLYPRGVHGIEIYNACNTELENAMAKIYAEKYGFLKFAGSDNHCGGEQKKLAGMESETPLKDEIDFVERIKSGGMRIFSTDLSGNE
nr:histidinol phosphatase [Clostridia bacterium]